MQKIKQRIIEIALEVSRTQVNKATKKHLCLLRARKAELERQLEVQEKKSGARQSGQGFAPKKHGITVGIVGFPSVGKSSMFSALTGTHSRAAEFEFTTVECKPGSFMYEDCEFTLLDLPGIIQGFSMGRGDYGRDVLAVVRTCDCIVMMLDAERGEAQREALTRELDLANVRLNERKPPISVTRKTIGGVHYMSSCRQTHLDNDLVQSILKQFNIHHADVTVNCDATPQQLIDSISNNVSYIPCVYTFNKADLLTMSEIDRLTTLDPHNVVISATEQMGFEWLKASVWHHINYIRVFTKSPSEKYPTFHDPILLKRGSTLADLCDKIHSSFLERFEYATIFGSSVKFSPTRKGITHELGDYDVIQIKLRT
ncbi:hypothetical protein PCE1_002545 [Barthelona sp. PCE]